MAFLNYIRVNYDCLRICKNKVVQYIIGTGIYKMPKDYGVTDFIIKLSDKTKDLNKNIKRNIKKS